MDNLVPNFCPICLKNVEELVPAPCENPEKYSGVALGMYHCPDCGCMVLAGLPHPPVCKDCCSKVLLDRGT